MKFTFTQLRRGKLAKGFGVVFGALLVISLAVGPNEAFARFAPKMYPPPAPAPAGPGFTPAGQPLRLQAKKGTLFELRKVVNNVVLNTATGPTQPLVYLRFKAIGLENTIISQSRAENTFLLTNSGTGMIGGEGQTIEVWAKANDLDLCVSLQVLQGIAYDYRGVLAGRIDEVLKTIGDAMNPFATGQLGPVGPCLPIKTLLPILAVFIDNGVPLPAELPVQNLDLDAYAVKATAPAGQLSVSLPKGTLQVVQ